MDKALLFISGSQSGNADNDGFEVLSYNFSTDREIDKRGLVVTSLKGLLLELEIYFDTNWWNELPLNFGFRYSHLLDRDLYGGPGSERFEFILPVNLFQR